MSQQAAPDRLRVLIEAGIALSSELSLDALLQQLVETAAQLTGARYAALGVIDQTGTALERFLTTGIDAETHDVDVLSLGPDRLTGIGGLALRSCSSTAFVQRRTTYELREECAPRAPRPVPRVRQSPAP